MYFIPDTKWVILNHKLSRFLPNQISYMTFGFLSRISTQLTARKLARGVIREFSIDVVHQPIPVSPREPSLLYGLGPPVVMGPMNGNMSYPPGMMRRRNLTIQKLGTSLGRLASGLLNRLMPGKLRAAALLVANERTRAAVPRPARGEIITLAENGVDFGIWSVGQRTPSTDRPVRFIFVGRLVDWKAVDLLLEAFARVQASAPPSLEILGDGSMRACSRSRPAAWASMTAFTLPARSRKPSARPGSARRTCSFCPACTNAAARSSWRPWPAVFRSSPRRGAVPWITSMNRAGSSCLRIPPRHSSRVWPRR